MPEMPEVHALADDLAERLVGHAIARFEVTTFSALKTFDPPASAVVGETVQDVTHFGKFLDIDLGDLHVVDPPREGRAGSAGTTCCRPTRNRVIAARIGLDDGSGIQLTEAGTKKSLAISVVRDPLEVPRLATLGPDPLSDAFTEERFAEVLAAAGRAQIKGVLRDQARIAGIGNAYSDEILHAAKMSPFKPAAMPPEDVHRLYEAMRRGARRRDPAVGGAAHGGPEGREEGGHARPRPHRRGLPGLRRHDPPGPVRRQQPAVLPDLPDRRQAARRPRAEPPRHHRSRDFAHASCRSRIGARRQDPKRESE